MPVPAKVAAEPTPVVQARPSTVTIYRCKGYAGEEFWSDTTCHTQRATIDRMTSVPGDLPFEQQVAIAQRQANEAAPLYVPPVPLPAARIGRDNSQSAGSSSLCAELDLELQQLDAAARRPQTAQAQDRIRERRMQVQAQRAALRC